MAQLKYRFTLNGLPATPYYSGDLSKQYSRESGQQFHRAKLSGALRFNAQDFDYIVGRPFDTRFALLIEIGNDLDGWATYFEGEFYKTDCDFNADDKILSATVETTDGYDKALAALDKTYNLVKLPVSNETVKIKKRPLLQIYALGESLLTNYLNGSSWEQETAFPVSSGNDLTSVYHFALMGSSPRFSLYGEGTPQEVAGDYAQATGDIWNNSDGAYTIEEEETFVGPGNEYDYKVFRNLDGVVLFSSLGNLAPVAVGDSLTFTAVHVDAEGTFTGLYTESVFYGRYLTSLDTFAGSPTLALPAEDIVSDLRNYTRASPYGEAKTRATSRSQAAATPYGTKSDGSFYLPPSTLTGEIFYPLQRSLWGFTSTWLSFTAEDWAAADSSSEFNLLRDAVSVAGAISELLTASGTGLTHAETPEYSEFLYSGANPLTGDYFRLLLTQKTNITSGQYDQPAQRADLSLGDVLGVLRDALGVYWYLDGDKLKLEHIKWFKNGGSYNGLPGLNADLTIFEQPKNAKPWAFSTNKYSFEKASMEERIEFKFMDKTSAGFEGVPIVINSGFAQKGNIVQVNTGVFTTDVDYMLADPASVSPDGFALLAAVYADEHDPDGYGNNLGFIIDAGGDLQADVLYNTTPFIRVAPDTDYLIENAQRVYWYTPGKADISGETLLGVTKTLTSPPSAGFLSVSSTVSNWPYLSITSNLLSLPFVEVGLGGETLTLQNGFLSWPHLQSLYLSYDLPAKNVSINGVNVTANGVRRLKTQNVKYPAGATDPDPMKVVRTQIGAGQIEEMAVHFSSRMASIKLIYDTE